MEAELKATYPHAHVKLVESGGGVFDVACDGKLIFSKQRIDGQRFPEDGEISKLIHQDKR